MPKRRRRSNTSFAIRVAIVVSLVSAVALALIAMRAGDSTDTTEPSKTATFTATEHTYEEQTVRAIAGEITLELINTSNGAHDLAIMREGVTITRSSDYTAEMSLGAVGWTAPRAVSSATVVLEPGRYQVVCTLPGHVEEGMVSLLIVEEAH
jgi:uncharacterized cupredoxin-like copper-binding protein